MSTVSTVNAVRDALAGSRFETARRLALDALATSAVAEDDARALRLLLHRAQQAQGDFAACQETLAAITSSSDADRREILLLQAEDFAAHAKDSHYRRSREAREGYSLDEFLDKYRALAAKCRAEAEEIPALEPGSSTNSVGSAPILGAIPRHPAGAATDRAKSERPGLPPGSAGGRTPHAGTGAQAEIRAEGESSPHSPSPGTGSLRGTLTFPDGSPVADATVTLGGPLSYTPPHPDDLRQDGKDLDQDATAIPTLTTRTATDGTYEFAQVEAGSHDFLAVTLDPEKFAIATRFLVHGLTVEAGQTLVRDAVVTEWESAVPLPLPEAPATTRWENQNLSRLDSLPLRNPFAFDFPPQMVEWKPSLPPAPDQILLDPQGNPVPFQRDRDGQTLLFFAELPAESSRAYGLYAGTPPEFPTPLQIEPEGDTALLSTGRAVFRIPWGDSSKLPPLLAVKGADDVWRGEGRWVLPDDLQVRQTTTTLRDQGPVRMEVEIVTTFNNGAEYRLLLTAHAGEAYLLALETSPDIEGAAFEFSLREFSGGRSFLHWTPEQSNSRHWHPLEAEDRELARLQESVPWWIPPAGFASALTPDGLTEKDYLAIFTLRRGEWIDRKFAAISRGPGDDPAWHRELDWPFPEMVGSTISMITTESRADGDVVFRFGFFDGQRQWGFLASDLDRNDGEDKELSRVQHKNSSPRLTDFMHWRLDEQDTAARPHLVANRDHLPAIRKKIDRPAFAQAWQNLQHPSAQGPVEGMRFQITNDPRIAWRKKRELMTLAPVRCRMTLLGRDFGDIYSPVGGRPLTHYAEDYDLLAASGVFSPDEERFLRAFLMLMGHLFSSPDMMNWRMGSRNANFETDRVDVVGTIGLTFHGNPDADAFSRHAAEGMAAALQAYCTPGSGKWYENPPCYYLHAAKCRLNIAYHLTTHGLLDPTTLPRLKDFLTWGILLLTPKQPASYDEMRDGLSPEAYETTEKLRRIAPIGDHAVLGKYLIDHLILLAPYFAEANPDFADFLVWAHRQSGGSGGLNYGNPSLLLARMDEATLGRPVPDHSLTSRRLEGFGAVFRGQFGTPEEFYLLFKQGPGGYRYHRTEGSILLFANGKPLIYDGGEGGETWRHSTLSFFDTHLPLAAGHVERFASFETVDFCQGVHPKVIPPGEPIFLSDDCRHTLVPVAFARYHEPDSANVRSVLWVKDEYVVLHDSLHLDPAIPRHWHLQVVAQSESGSAAEGYRFQGRFGTDLQVLLPGPVPEEEAVEDLPLHEYSSEVSSRFAMRHLRIRREKADHYAAVLRPLPPDAEPLAAEILANGSHLRVTGSGIDDDHFFSRTGEEFRLEDGSFQGRYGMVLRRPEETTLCLTDPGTLTVGEREIRLEGSLRASVTFSAHTLRLEAQGKGTLTVRRGSNEESFALNGSLRTKRPME